MKDKDCSNCKHFNYGTCPLSMAEKHKINDDNPECPNWEDDEIDDD